MKLLSHVMIVKPITCINQIKSGTETRVLHSYHNIHAFAGLFFK